jgi:hypothetical protein
MHPILTQQMAQHRTDAFHREVEADRRSALVKGAADRHPFAVRERLTRAFGRLGLRLRGSAA